MAKEYRKLKRASNCSQEDCYRHTNFKMTRFAVSRALANEHKIWLAVPMSVQLEESPERPIMTNDMQAFMCQSCGIAFARNSQELNSRKDFTTPMHVVRGARLFDAVQLGFQPLVALKRLIDMPVENWPLSLRPSFPTWYPCQEPSEKEYFTFWRKTFKVAVNATDHEGRAVAEAADNALADCFHRSKDGGLREVTELFLTLNPDIDVEMG